MCESEEPLRARAVTVGDEVSVRTMRRPSHQVHRGSSWIVRRSEDSEGKLNGVRTERVLVRHLAREQKKTAGANRPLSGFVTD
jgi:hypothetical protein